jgi:hypothetical protein
MGRSYLLEFGLTLHKIENWLSFTWALYSTLDAVTDRWTPGNNFEMNSPVLFYLSTEWSNTVLNTYILHDFLKRF